LIGLIISVILLLSGNVLAEESICFDKNTAGNIVVEIEKCRIDEKKIDILIKQNQELEKQISLLNQVIEKQKEQQEILKKEVESYKTLLATQKAGYEEEIKKAKPSLFNEMLKAFGFVGAGIVIGLLL